MAYGTMVRSARESMDVTCERCGTEYEFEEALVSERGTTVKCTQCGHLFKVFRPGGESARPWILRHSDGREETLDSLGQLQKRITRGEVKPTDRISRSGADWKPLGEIAELEPFFRAARTAAETARTAPSSRPPRGSNRPPGGSNRPPRGSSRPPGGSSRPPGGSSRPPLRTPKRTLMGMGTESSPPVAPPSRPPSPERADATTQDEPRRRKPVSAPPRSEPPARSEPPRPPPKPPARDPDATAGGAQKEIALDATLRAPADMVIPPPQDADATVEDSSPPSVSRSAPTLEAPAPKAPSLDPAPTAGTGRKHVLYLDEEEAPALPKKKRRVLPWVFLILLVAGGAAAALQWDRIAPMIGMAAEGPDPLAAGDEALALDHREGYATAVDAYSDAPESWEAEVRIGRAHAAWAQLLRFRAEDLDARAVTDPSLASESAQLHEESREHAEAAVEHANASLSSRPQNAAAELVLADAKRLLGQEGAQAHLDRAAEGLAEPTPQLRLSQALARAAGPDGLAAALPHARRAAEMADAPIRALLLLARVALSADDVGEARAAIRDIRERVPDHPEATHLAEAIDQGLPPAAPVVAVTDGGVADAGTPVAPEEPEAPAETDDGRETEAAASNRGGQTGGMPRDRDYSWYIRQGDELRRGGSHAEAKEHYERALELRPGSTEATTGLGYVELMSGRINAAIPLFRNAVRADYGDAYMGLGDAYRRLGRTAEARQVYESYLRSQPGGVHAGRARRLLEEMPGGQPPTMEAAPTTEGAPTMEAEPTETPTMDPAPTMEAEAAPTMEAPPAEAPEPAPVEGAEE